MNGDNEIFIQIRFMIVSKQNDINYELGQKTVGKFVQFVY